MKTEKGWKIGITVILMMAVSCGWGMRVVTTTTQLTELVSEVGGERIELRGLMGPGVDPHLYKATPRDVQFLQRADLIIYNGYFLEGKLTELLSRISETGKEVLAVSEALPKDRLIGDEEYGKDPHIWFDPELWAGVVQLVEDRLVEMDREGEKYYRERGRRYREAIEQMVNWVDKRLEGLDASKRILVTSHDAYNYFGRAFGFKVVGIQGLSTVTEAGLADMSQMIDYIKSNSIPAIFVESSVSPSTIERVSEASGAQVGGELFSDAMGGKEEIRDGKSGEKFAVGTYIGMMKYNIDVIVHGLGE